MSQTIQPSLILVCDDLKTAELYERELRLYTHFSILKAASIESAYDQFRTFPMLGWFIDFKTLLKQTGKAKILLHEISESITVCKMRLDPITQMITGTLNDVSYQGPSLLRHFFEEVLHRSTPRSMRRVTRHPRIWSGVLKVPTAQGPVAEVKISTLDVSRDGCYIATTVPAVAQQLFWVEFLEVERLAIQLEVRWVQPWGVRSQRLPGFGARFANLTDADKERIDDVIRPKFSGVNPPQLWMAGQL